MIRIIKSIPHQLTLTAYPGVGYPDGQRWQIRFSGVAWRNPVVLSRRKRMIIRMLGNVMRAEPGELQREPFSTRINPFVADACHRLPVAIQVGDQQFPLRRKTKRNGQFEESIPVPAAAIEAARINDHSARFQVVSRIDNRPMTEGLIYLFARTGISVISDIDDTIKESQVENKRLLLANTFLRQFRSVPGMPDLYQDWHQAGAAFHYVSSSPWQLYDALKALNTDLGFPAGSMHLRNFRLRDQLFQRLIIRRRGKATEIRKLLRSMPERQFVLIGDSGEKDPKIYRRMCHEFPGQVQAVFIRQLAHRPMEPEQHQQLRQALPDGPCETFSDAGELRQLASPLFER